MMPPTGANSMSLPTPERVVIIDIDGLRADVLQQALNGGHMPHLLRLVRAGGVSTAHSVAALSVAPSITFAAQASIFTGAHPWQPPRIGFIRRADLRLAHRLRKRSCYIWRGYRSVDYTSMRPGGRSDAIGGGYGLCAAPVVAGGRSLTTHGWLDSTD